MRKAVVLLSGGLDSAVTLAVARADGFAVHALSVDYGQRHRSELVAARRIARSAGVEDHRVVCINLSAFGGSALTDDIPVPKGGECRDAIPPTYVPARNMVLASAAIGWAESLGSRTVYLGANAVDYSGYPDCRREFFDAMERAADIGTKAGSEGDRWSILTPLVAMGKAEIIQLGRDLGVAFADTVSCYDADDDGRACGRCDSCAIRRAGFRDAGIADPTRYR